MAVCDGLRDRPIDAGDGDGRGMPGIAAKAVPAPPPCLIGRLAREQHGAAILAGDGHDTGIGIDTLEPVAQRGHAQADQRLHIVGGGGTGGGRILHAIDGLVLAAHRLVHPVVGDNAGVAGAITGQDGAVAGAGLRCRMRLIATGKDDAARQLGKASGEGGAILGEEVCGKLVHGNRDDEARRCRLRAGRGGRGDRSRRGSRSRCRRLRHRAAAHKKRRRQRPETRHSHIASVRHLPLGR